jgi:hypothetical protein
MTGFPFDHPYLVAVDGLNVQHARPKGNRKGTVMKSIEMIKADFVSALTAYSTVREKLGKAFDAARAALVGKSKSVGKLKELRKTLLAWAEEAKVNPETAKSVVSALMIEADLKIRSRSEGGTGKAKAKKAHIAKIVEFCHGFLGDDDDEIAAVLLAAYRSLKK